MSLFTHSALEDALGEESRLRRLERDAHLGEQFDARLDLERGDLLRENLDGKR